MTFQNTPSMLISRNQLMALQSVKATGIVQGPMLEMTIRQEYKNFTHDTLEASYTFPMGWGASFMDLHVEIAGKRLSGLVIEKRAAITGYEKAIADGDTPIMLEKNSEGIYTASLGNLKPGEAATIEYRYAQLLLVEEGCARICLPTTIAPRYGKEQFGGIQEHQSAQADMLVQYPLTLSLLLSGGTEKCTIESPSHHIEVTQNTSGTLVELSRDGFLDRDFILNLSGLKNQSFCMVAPDKHTGSESCTVLASFNPNIDENQIAGPVALKILVDCSGSMNGDSIESAKKALHQVLISLNPDDQLSYSQFGDTVEHAFEELKPATPFNVAAASIFVSNTQANLGGTQIERALFSTFRLKEKDAQADVLLITDGEVWDTANIIETAKQSGQRIFAIGVGDAPAETLLRELAEATGGACELVAPNGDIQAAITRMFHRLRQPRAHEIQIDWGHDEKPEWISGISAAIFNLNTRHVFAGFKSPPQRPATLSFQLGSNPKRYSVQASTLFHSDSNIVSRLGAALRLKNMPEESQTALALHYQLITRQTNYLLTYIRPEEEKVTGLPELQRVSQMLAAGWSGAGTIKDMMGPQVRFSRSRQSLDASYDFPRVFRSTANSKITAQECDDECNSLEDFAAPAKASKQRAQRPLAPNEIINLANQWIQNPADIEKFIKAIDAKLIDANLTSLLNQLSPLLSDKDAWTVILSWLLIDSRTKDRWKPKTQLAIEAMANELPKDQLKTSLAIVNSHPGALFNGPLSVEEKSAWNPINWLRKLAD
jgi:Ca-activated chloride channel family protein